MNVPLVSSIELLDRAEPLLESESPADLMQAGALCRMALETHCRGMVMRRSLAGPPFCWHIRLRAYDVLTADDVRHLRELFDLGGRAVHNRVFTVEHAKTLYVGVQKFVSERE